MPFKNPPIPLKIARKTVSLIMDILLVSLHSIDLTGCFGATNLSLNYWFILESEFKLVPKIWSATLRNEVARNFCIQMQLLEWQVKLVKTPLNWFDQVKLWCIPGVISIFRRKFNHFCWFIIEIPYIDSIHSCSTRTHCVRFFNSIP